MVMGLFSGCGNLQSATGTGTSKDGKYQIVCTIFPEYDWVKQIIGESAEQFELTMLLADGVDLHSYQPTAEDILKIATCDLFICVGGESDKWTEDALKEKSNKNRKVVKLLEVLGDHAKEEELVEGMQPEHEEDGHDEDVHEEDGHDHEDMEYDEHIWLSLQNAEICVKNLSEAIQAMDTAGKEVYAANTEQYLKQIEALDGEYREAAAQGSKDTLVFADRFPFRYMMEDYGLNYYAAFAGCSAETEASFETIIFLAEKLDELALENVIVTETSDWKIAQTVINTTKSKTQGILIMDSMQSITRKDAKAGVTYLSVMETNLNVFREALN